MSTNLLPREAYSEKPVMRTVLFAIIAGLLFAVAFGFLFGVIAYVTLRILRAESVFWQGLWVLVIGSALGGLFFGSFYFIWMRVFVRRKTSDILDKIYSRDPQMAPPPENDEDFRYRLPAGYLITPHMNVGGILYLGKSGLMFQPHKINLAKYSSPILLNPLATVKLSVVPHKVNPFLRLAAKSVPPMITVTARSNTGNFLVPEPAKTCRAIEQSIAELLSEALDGL